MNITTLLIVITVGISLAAWRDAGLMSRWIMNPYQVAQRGQYYRLLTSGFLHADWGHLLFNMIALYSFGGFIELLFGYLFPGRSTLYYVGFYLIAIVVSDLPTLLRHRTNPGYNSLGASGGVSAIVFAAILFQPLSPIALIFIPIPIPGFIFGALYLAYSYYEARRGYGNVNHDAHLYGGLFGILFLIVVYPDVLPRFLEQISSWRPF